MAGKSSMKQLPWVFLAVLGLIMASPVPAGAEDATTAQESDAPDPFAGMAEAEEVDVVEEEDSNDPFEVLNRFTSSLNGILRGVFLDPLADGYQTVTPEPVQDAISNAASNLVEPVSAASSLLQGDTENASAATERFIVNSTVGLGGTRDAATEMGIEARENDPGLAAGTEGVEAGPHIVLPVVGPSNLRDAPGDIATGLIPVVGVAKAVKSADDYVKNKDKLRELSEGALDPYIAEREAYEQNRRYKIEQAREAMGMDTGDAKLADGPVPLEESP